MSLSDPKFNPYILRKIPIPVLSFQPKSSSSLTKEMPSTQTFNPPPPPLPSHLQISYPRSSILLITINKPQSLNCLSTSDHYAFDSLYSWYDANPLLLCCVLTGTGRSFCAGADLKEWNDSHSSQSGGKERKMPASGFGGLSRRSGKKPVICAVNGICFGGGCEMIINADMIIASSTAKFALPEVKIGVVALAGALTRLVRTVGRQRAMEIALTGRTLSAEEAREWGLVNRVVEEGKAVEEAIRMAELVVGNSPDSVIVSREGVKMGWEGVGAEEGTRLLREGWYGRIEGGENMREGVRSFVEKRKPRWVPSKL